MIWLTVAEKWLRLPLAVVDPSTTAIAIVDAVGADAHEQVAVSAALRAQRQPFDCG